MTDCACGHVASEHQPDCQAVLGPDKFCGCRGYWPEGDSPDPRFRAQQQEAVNEKEMPAWTVDALCRKRSMPGIHWAEAFLDDMKYQADPDDYEWAATTVQVLRDCLRCPVRQQCLEWAFEKTVFQSYGDVNMLTKHEAKCKSRRCRGCLPGGPKVERGEFTIEPIHEGTYGGVPGPVREHFSKRPNPIEACNRWWEAFTRRRGWVQEPDDQEVIA